MKSTIFLITLPTGQQVRAIEMKGQDIFRGKIFRDELKKFWFEDDLQKIEKL
jgi:hypothetical protein